MSQVAAIQMGFRTTHQFLEGTTADVTPAQAAWQPPGAAHTIAANYAHVAFAEDAVINAAIRAGAPLMAGHFAGKTGASEPPPPGPGWDEWARRVTVDLPALREYANAVYAETDRYLESLSDGDLTREIDMGTAGKYPLGQLLTIMMANSAWHTGEIACLKGLQGAKGYPA